MPPSGKCPRRIGPAAAMVDDFEKKKNTNKTQLLPSFLTVDQRKKAIESRDPPGTLYLLPRRD
jgi:hypothetical protein